MRNLLSQIKLAIFLLFCMMIFNALIWFVTDSQLYGHNQMSENLKFILAYSVDFYAIFLITVINFLILHHREKKDSLTPILKYGVVNFSLLLLVLLADLRLVAPFHQPLQNDETKFVISFILNNFVYLLTTLYFVLLSIKMYNNLIKIASITCAFTQLMMLMTINFEFQILVKNNFLFSHICFVRNAVDTCVYASFIWLAYAIHKATKNKLKDENKIA